MLSLKGKATPAPPRRLPKVSRRASVGLTQDFWVLDLTTMESRQLTHLDSTAKMRTFDITPDGTQIVFDRLSEDSDIVLIDLGDPDLQLQDAPRSE